MGTGNIAGIALVADNLALFDIGADLQKRQRTHVSVNTDKIILVGMFDRHPVAPAVIFAVGYYFTLGDCPNLASITRRHIKTIVRRAAVGTARSVAT